MQLCGNIGRGRFREREKNAIFACYAISRTMVGQQVTKKIQQSLRSRSGGSLHNCRWEASGGLHQTPILPGHLFREKGKLPEMCESLHMLHSHGKNPLCLVTPCVFEQAHDILDPPQANRGVGTNKDHDTNVEL